MMKPEKAELVRCYDCRFFKPLGKGYTGWCKDNRDGKKSIRVNAMDYCDDAEKKEVKK